MIKLGRCQNLGSERTPGEISLQPLMLGLDFRVIFIFVYIAHLTKFTRGSSLLTEKSLFIEIKSGRKY